MFDTSIDPFVQFDRLLKEAIAKQVPEANAMSLATVDEKGTPSVRIVYLKEVSQEGFVFYGNYESHKGKDIDANPQVCLNFHWPVLWHQIRITGKASKISAEESDKYFATRARLSQLGAWASKQSSEIPDQEWLSRRVQEYEKQFEGQPVPRPQNWGGWRVIPEEIEFWFGLNGRLHERYIYKREGKSWKTFQRSP
ncbi:pyridoxamine 5'-phosphate oxidase [Bdellovibrio bacteriovorus]|uniref:Pyridoxamine 5'-phosphate oxidase n=1 Tax=Bdellovibrio bacteriovorus TaxID=959 RepID=A0A150WM21_BDEBC|nr:pyridoxamine 5'-phosphate oxidase [Bdellovibrio bacteriovorus]KYG65502.1 pyridoxamine 5'-phosphate oxidase [Bdellovibrio bacteriovorus]